MAFGPIFVWLAGWLGVVGWLGGWLFGSIEPVFAGRGQEVQIGWRLRGQVAVWAIFWFSGWLVGSREPVFAWSVPEWPVLTQKWPTLINSFISLINSFISGHKNHFSRNSLFFETPCIYSPLGGPGINHSGQSDRVRPHGAMDGHVY